MFEYQPFRHYKSGTRLSWHEIREEHWLVRIGCRWMFAALGMPLPRGLG